MRLRTLRQELRNSRYNTICVKKIKFITMSLFKESILIYLNLKFQWVIWRKTWKCKLNWSTTRQNLSRHVLVLISTSHKLRVAIRYTSVRSKPSSWIGSAKLTRLSWNKSNYTWSWVWSRISGLRRQISKMIRWRRIRTINQMSELTK